MRIAARQLIFGASCLCLIRTALTSIPSSACAVTNNMSTSPNTSTATSYVKGSSSVAFITTPDEALAKKIAHSLVEKKLAACVNIIPKITSIYMWEDKVQEDGEFLLMVKTRTSRVEELTKHVRDNHSYSVAEVITLPIENGNPSYMEWIERTVPDLLEAKQS